MTRVPRLCARLQGFGTSIFAEMTELAARYDATNLGQGFPDFDGPSFVRDAAIEAIRAGHNQYARSSGLLSLVQAIATHHERFYGLSYDPVSEVTVHSGATEALFASLQALCDVGDEVVLFEPYYDAYRAAIAMAGAVPRVVTLQAPAFTYDAAELERAVTPKTKVILLNTPHNPTGKVYTRTELEHIAKLAIAHDLIVVADEVYEHLVFEGRHTSIASLPGMRDRTIVVSSTGKTFSLTGWKIGFALASEPLSRAVRTAHQFVTFATATPLQEAMVTALRAPDAYYTTFLAEYRARRERLCHGLRRAGLAVLEPQGSYFACVDLRPLGVDDDLRFCRSLAEHARVVAVPCSPFCETKDAPLLVRFAFCKSDAVLDEGISRLASGLARSLRALEGVPRTPGPPPPP